MNIHQTHLIWIALLLSLLVGCSKNESIENPIEIKNLYQIQPSIDLADSIQNKRYEIYKRYNVPVYFNDTVAKQYYGQSLSGDSIYLYETLDLPWRYTGRTDNQFVYHYMTDPIDQMASLRFIEDFLTIASKPLTPLSVFIVDSVSSTAKLEQKTYTYANADSTFIFNEKITFYTGTRTILFAGISKFDNQVSHLKEKATKEVIRTMIKQRIPNYPNQLAEFYTFSDKNFYGKRWTELDNTIQPVLGEATFSVWILSDIGYNYFKREYGHSETELEDATNYARKSIGKFGFVYSKIGYNSPSNSYEDLEAFIDEILRYDKKEFIRLWQESPIVIQKANVLYSIIENELQFQL